MAVKTVEPSAARSRAAASLRTDRLATSVSDIETPEGVVLGLQRTAGNAAVQRLLVTSGQFAKVTDAGALSRRGKTLKEIERLLDQYHRLRREALHLKPGSGMDQHQQVLLDLVTTTDFWLNSHKGDKSRSARRTGGINKLNADAMTELAEAMSFRKDASSMKSLGIKEFQPADNKFISKMNGNASSVLEKIGTAMGAAVPKPGDSVEAEVSVSIPVDPSGVGYVGFRILATASRMDDTATNVRFEVAVTGGGKVPGIADIGGELGFFIQSQGATPQEAMKLISYAWYQRFRGSKAIPNEVANFMWGGSTSVVGWRRSEQWAANIEKEAFSRKDGDKPLSSGVGSAATTNQFVRMGILGGVSAEGGVGGKATVGGAVGVNAGVHYDQKSVEAGKAKKQGKLGLPMAAPTRRGQTTKLGTSFLTVDAGVSAACGPFSGELGASLEYMFRKADKGSRNEGYISASFSATAPLLVDSTINQVIFDAIKDLMPQAQRATHTLKKKAESSKEAKGAASLTALQGAGDSIAPAFSKLAFNDFGDKFSSSATREAPTFDLAGDEYDLTSKADQLKAGAEIASIKDFTLSFNAGYQFGEGKEGWTFDIQVSQATGVDVSASVAALTLKKSSRLLRLIWGRDGGKWKFAWD